MVGVVALRRSLGLNTGRLGHVEYCVEQLRVLVATGGVEQSLDRAPEAMVLISHVLIGLGLAFAEASLSPAAPFSSTLEVQLAWWAGRRKN